MIMYDISMITSSERKTTSGLVILYFPGDEVKDFMEGDSDDRDLWRRRTINLQRKV